MLRSEVNRILRESDAFIRSFGYVLPPFAYLSPDELKESVSSSGAMIRDHALGWDITDYGQGRFADLGLFLFTVRNGNARNVAQGMGMLYAEKIMISGEDQISPLHRHHLKTEDIINRGGAKLALELFTSDEEGGLDDRNDVRVRCDGIWRTLPAGAILELSPGESITLEPHCWHRFWGQGGSVLIGEVSNVNDDHADNVFADEIGRFSRIVEDEPPLHLLVSDYERWFA